MSFRPAMLSLAVAIAAGTASGPAVAMSDAGLAKVAQQRLQGDRTGACFAVAVVEQSSVSRAFACADPADRARIGATSAFEIGSVSKTMTAALLADLIVKGEASLDDPLAAWLPEGTAVPEFEGQPILLRHVVTHTSGLPALPPGAPIDDPADPYAAITPADLLQALGRVELSQAPGTQAEYSNFAGMLLSYALAQRTGQDFETLLDESLFTPLAMDGAYIARPPADVREAAGHLPNGQPTSAWRFPVDLAGVGGVRATLDDMVRYVQAHLGQRESALERALALSQQPVVTDAGPPMAMNWMRVPVNGRTVHVHEGGTGGFSSFVGFDRARERGVVVLADTALTALGGLGSIGLHLLDPAVPLGKPRKAIVAAPELLEALVGDYRLHGLKVQLRRNGNTLEVQAEGQPVLAMGHDDAGDFYPLEVDALLRPQPGADGRYGFTLHQGGGVVQAQRVDGELDAAPAAAAGPAPTAAGLAAYTGVYPLMSQLALTVSVRGDTLQAQATGQGAFALQPRSADVFAAPDYGIEIRFERDANGSVSALNLHQAGQVLRGERSR